MKGFMETQAMLTGEGAHRCVCGRIRISPMGCGSVVQAHVRGLPGRSCFFGFCIELCGRRYPLPPLLSCDGEALLSVYACAFCPEDTVGGHVLLTTDPCAPDGCMRIACGCISPCVRQPCCPPDPRPLFGAPPRPLPGGSISC